MEQDLQGTELDGNLLGYVFICGAKFRSIFLGLDKFNCEEFEGAVIGDWGIDEIDKGPTRSCNEINT